MQYASLAYADFRAVVSAQSLTCCADSMVMENAIRSASHCLSVWLSYLLVMALASHVATPHAVEGWHTQHGLAACACHGFERGCADQ